MKPTYRKEKHDEVIYLLGGVVAHGVHDVAKVEQVKLALAIPVVDVTDLLNS